LPEETKQKKICLETKQPPPPEPVNVAPFTGAPLKKGLTSPPPEPVGTPPFSQAKPAQPKDSKKNAQTEGKQ